jgi:hypothetical protein
VIRASARQVSRLRALSAPRAPSAPIRPGVPLVHQPWPRKRHERARQTCEGRLHQDVLERRDLRPLGLGSVVARVQGRDRRLPVGREASTQRALNPAGRRMRRAHPLLIDEQISARPHEGISRGRGRYRRPGSRSVAFRAMLSSAARSGPSAGNDPFPPVSGMAASIVRNAARATNASARKAAL